MRENLLLLKNKFAMKKLLLFFSRKVNIYFNEKKILMCFMCFLYLPNED